MSDPKRATLITVGAPKSGKNSVCKTVRLTINLDESNESKYPELNYKELVIAEDRKKKVENGKINNKLDPFSDNDDELEKVAKKFEQKYGGKSTYGRKGRSKHDDFADIGMGYDETDPFIDNTDNYDEMMPPETDTIYGGFYINCGSLEFKTVPDKRGSDVENGRRNKRRLSSSSSEESSESSSESSADEKETKTLPNGAVHNEHRKKKNKDVDKKKVKKIRRADSSAPTSGRQTSDDTAHGDAESADSRTSQSDSLTSKPAPSSENAVTSDSSRDVEAKSEVKLPQPVVQVLELLESAVSKHLAEHPETQSAQLIASNEKHLLNLNATIAACSCSARARRAAWGRAARCVRAARAALLHRVQARAQAQEHTKVSAATTPTTTATPTVTAAANKRKNSDEPEEVISLSAEEREAKIVDTLQRLKALIEDRTPAMMTSYQAECDRVMEERKKVQTGSDGRQVEKRLPKRRFPWCQRARGLLARLKRLAGQDAATALLVKRALPLFPSGFVRVPTLLRQAE